ncbi:hypothetical protein L6452_08743 [Arctium lappa]|uniref:Uncharacterized protein n=1 Tax=Arctium lappa TaxID=4217 RepID=A0ACB9DIJ8_ARCLA|nr:hypothetical protein L6452_08743 [Arctium lappa]
MLVTTSVQFEAFLSSSSFHQSVPIQNQKNSLSTINHDRELHHSRSSLTLIAQGFRELHSLLSPVLMSLTLGFIFLANQAIDISCSFRVELKN